MEILRLYLIAIRNIILGFSIIYFRLITKPKKLIKIISTQLFFYKTLAGRGRFEQKNPDEIINSTKKYNINIDTDCYFWHEDPSYVKDILTLCIITKLIAAKRIFEIGTLDGYSALHFAMNSESDTKIFTLDLSPEADGNTVLKSTTVDISHQMKHSKVQKYRFSDTPYDNKINCLFGDSANYDYSEFYNSIDLFFIDGAHSYEYVKSDTLNALKCIRVGGIIAWHDYGRMGVNGVTKWLREFSRRGNKVYSVPGSSLAYYINK